MNNILQKRIEEAAFTESYMYETIQEKNAAYNTAMKVAKFALQNQWISVDERLPKEGELVFMKCKNNDINTFCSGVYEGIKDEWYEDGIGYVDNVTHWMPIPALLENE